MFTSYELTREGTIAACSALVPKVFSRIEVDDANQCVLCYGKTNHLNVKLRFNNGANEYFWFYNDDGTVKTAWESGSNTTAFLYGTDSWLIRYFTSYGFPCIMIFTNDNGDVIHMQDGGNLKNNVGIETAHLGMNHTWMAPNGADVVSLVPIPATSSDGEPSNLKGIWYAPVMSNLGVAQWSTLNIGNKTYMKCYNWFFET